MKLSRQKFVRRLLNYYRRNFHVTCPYRVLVDGTFAFQALQWKIQIDEQLKAYLQTDEIVCSTSLCAIRETELLGELWSGASTPDVTHIVVGRVAFGAMLILKQYEIVRCDHYPAVTAERCFETLLVQDRTQQYFLASQVRRQATPRDTTRLRVVLLVRSCSVVVSARIQPHQSARSADHVDHAQRHQFGTSVDSVDVDGRTRNARTTEFDGLRVESIETDQSRTSAGRADRRPDEEEEEETQRRQSAGEQEEEEEVGDERHRRLSTARPKKEETPNATTSSFVALEGFSSRSAKELFHSRISSSHLKTVSDRNVLLVVSVDDEHVAGGGAPLGSLWLSAGLFPFLARTSLVHRPVLSGASLPSTRRSLLLDVSAADSLLLRELGVCSGTSGATDAKPPTNVRLVQIYVHGDYRTIFGKKESVLYLSNHQSSGSVAHRTVTCRTAVARTSSRLGHHEHVGHSAAQLGTHPIRAEERPQMDSSLRLLLSAGRIPSDVTRRPARHGPFVILARVHLRASQRPGRHRSRRERHAPNPTQRTARLVGHLSRRHPLQSHRQRVGRSSVASGRARQRLRAITTASLSSLGRDHCRHQSAARSIGRRVRCHRHVLSNLRSRATHSFGSPFDDR
jgi:rRNA-processing protein FCF1